MENMHLARLRKDGNTFEVVIDPDLAMAYREGKEVSFPEVLKSEKIFFDAKKGQVASTEKLKVLFETEDDLEIAKMIVKKGEIQLSQEYREQKREEKRKQILTMIQQNGVDPKTKYPHPMTRVEAAFEESKAKIDENKTAEAQIDDILKEIRKVLPIKFVTKEVQVHIPAEHAAKMYGTVTSFGKILNESWQNDGSWLCIIEIPGGLETDFYDKLNAMSQGSVEAKVVKVGE